MKTQKLWYKEWFASDLYMQVYKHRDYIEAESFLIFILETLNLSKNTTFLDAACGAGRHSNFLNDLGYNVVGFDLSKTLLKIASSNSKLKKFVNSDIRNIFFKKEFDVILNLFTSFGYFENDDENFAFFVNSKSFLKNNGYIVFDYFNNIFLTENIEPYSNRIQDGVTIKEHRYFADGRIIKEITIVDNNNNAQHFVESVKIYSFEQLSIMFSKIGYKIVKIFGGYSGQEFEEKKSKRLILVLQHA